MTDEPVTVAVGGPGRGAALEPLRARYAHWLGLDEAQVAIDREEAATDIRAMQLVLRMERADPPSWHRALAAAATGAAALCLDPRSEPGGEWHEAISDYCRGHIRKVTRRARGAHWAAAQELPGITIDRDGTQVRVLVPGLVTELDSRISRLQVGGTDVEPDAAPDPAQPPGDQPGAGSLGVDQPGVGSLGVDRPGVGSLGVDQPGAGPLGVDQPDAGPPGGEKLGARQLEVWLAPTPVMTLGKAMAQAGHAGMIAAALLAGTDQDALVEWADAGCPATARRASDAEWAALTASMSDQARAWSAERLLAVRDAGFTEVAPGTVTVVGRAPRAR